MEYLVGLLTFSCMMIGIVIIVLKLYRWVMAIFTTAKATTVSCPQCGRQEHVVFRHGYRKDFWCDNCRVIVVAKQRPG